MELSRLPDAGTWNHQGARIGFEVLWPTKVEHGVRLLGNTTAREDGDRWSVGYDIEVDRHWATCAVRATRLTPAGSQERHLEVDGDGQWWIDGSRAPLLDGCVDIDFESSAVTNCLPVHRLDLQRGLPIEASAAFVRTDLTVERLEQRYTLRGFDRGGPVFDYESATFDFSCELRYDSCGLIIEYPGIAVRDS